ncbi:MAG TPA: TRAP transporter substrate-binding protein DctP [Vicinamibacteria bacterium]|nr:TRAP transporter substrate-binding protein DctP [Vicinamibacteria bacterium]
MRVPRLVLSAALLLAACQENRILRASHQWPDGDVRGEMLEIIRTELESAGVDLKIRIYPGQSLFEATEQWPAMTRGRLDISVFPLAYAAGRHPEFNLTLMPGLVKSHAHAQRVNDSPFMDEIRRRVAEQGVLVLADAWLAGGFASKSGCILVPGDIKGQTIRGAGKAFEQMLLGAGGSITSMPSSEIYTAMQTGVLDATMTSSISFVSFRLYEQVQCLTAPGETALWFMYQPILMSKRSFDGLTDQQQAALKDASVKAEVFFSQQAKELDREAESTFERAGVRVVRLSPEQLDGWLALANETSYRLFAEEVEGGKALLDQALGVE